MPHVVFVAKESSTEEQPQTTDNVAAYDVKIVCGLLEAIAMVMTGFQSALDKV